MVFGFTSVLLYFMAFMFMGKGLHELQMGEALSLTAAKFAPEISWLGMYPTWETFIGQMILVVLFLGALLYTFVIKPESIHRTLKMKHNISRVTSAWFMIWPSISPNTRNAVKNF